MSSGTYEPEEPEHDDTEDDPEDATSDATTADDDEGEIGEREQRVAS